MIALTCTQEDASPPRSLAGGQPDKYYYGPDEEAPTKDLEHLIGDGLVVVRYRAYLDPADHRTIDRFVADTEPPYVIAAPDPAQAEPVRAIVAFRTLSCSKVIRAELERFRDEGVADVQRRRS